MRRKLERWLLPSLFALWLIVLLRITVFRDGCFRHGLFSGRVEWIPFVYLAKLIEVGYWRYFTYLFVGNLIWFVPAGIYVRLHDVRRAAEGAPRRHGLCRAAALGFCLSLGIELAQFVLGSGVTEVEDLILNTIGAVLGWLAAGFGRKARRSAAGNRRFRQSAFGNRQSETGDRHQ